MYVIPSIMNSDLLKLFIYTFLFIFIKKTKIYTFNLLSVTTIVAGSITNRSQYDLSSATKLIKSFSNFVTLGLR